VDISLYKMISGFFPRFDWINRSKLCHPFRDISACIFRFYGGQYGL